MRIGIIGTRGIPNHYGGFEQLAEYLSVELVKRGHAVWVYNSSLHPNKSENHKGVKLISCFDPESMLGTAGQFIYDFNCIMDSRQRNFEVILQLGYTSSSVWYWLLPKSSIIITNMDGLEWKRSKYNKPVQKFLKYAEKLAAKNSDYLISDSPGIQNHLKNTYQLNSTFIPYGANIFPENPDQYIADTNVLKPFNLTPYSYYLLICRFEPENNVETVIQGYLQSGKTMQLILLGVSKNKYSAYLKNKYTSDKIVFHQPIYDLNTLNHLRYFSAIYFHGHSVGGTNPSLLEAMASQALICAHNNIFNEAVLGRDAYYFKNAADLALVFNSENLSQNRETFIPNNLLKIEQQYNWIKIIDAYEDLMLKTLKQ